MYPSSNYSPNNISTSSLFNINILSPSMQYEHEFLQYLPDHHFFQPASYDQNLDTNIIAEEEDSEKLDKQEEDREELVLKGRKKKKKDKTNNTTTTRKNSKSNSAGAAKKDRHSKINTAHGPRDRRMRLSLEVARSFFNLQDLLGFDKASKTVEWLLTKSKSAVNDLVQKINKENCSTTPIGGAAINASSPSESCEVISGVIDESAATNNNNVIHKQKKKNKVKSTRRTVSHPVIAKELRVQARARARERTKIKAGVDLKKSLGCWNPFEEHHESGIMNVVDNCNLVDTGNNWSAPFIYNTEISQEDQLTNFQYSGKLWED